MQEVFQNGAKGVDERKPFVQYDGFDSLKHVELVVAFESRFGVELSPDEVSRLTSVAGARDILTARHIDV